MICVCVFGVVYVMIEERRVVVLIMGISFEVYVVGNNEICGLEVYGFNKALKGWMD